MKKLLIIGNFDHAGLNPINGQTQKTRELFELLKLEKSFSVDTWDTEYFNNKKVGSFITLFWKLLYNSYYVILPARRSIKVLPKIVLFFASLKKSKVIYVVIGGWLHEILGHSKKQVNILNKLDAILIETDEMRDKCSSLGLKNIHTLSNFKIIEPLDSPDNGDEVLKGVFVSRIIREKGVFLLLDAIRELNAKYRDRIIIDFYGPIQDCEEEFLNTTSEIENANYKGFLNPDVIQQTLSNYDFMIFPTYYKGEGFPGALIDAIFSTLPVIASDWKYNQEIVTHKETGLVFEAKNIHSLVNALEEIINNPEGLEVYKDNIRQLQKKFHYKQALSSLKEFL